MSLTTQLITYIYHATSLLGYKPDPHSSFPFQKLVIRIWSVNIMLRGPQKIFINSSIEPSHNELALHTQSILIRKGNDEEDRAQLGWWRW